MACCELGNTFLGVFRLFSLFCLSKMGRRQSRNPSAHHTTLGRSSWRFVFGKISLLDRVRRERVAILFFCVFCLRKRRVRAEKEKESEGNAESLSIDFRFSTFNFHASSIRSRSGRQSRVSRIRNNLTRHLIYNQPWACSWNVPCLMLGDTAGYASNSNSKLWNTSVPSWY